MLDEKEKVQRIIEVSKLYYINDMTQNEIAKELGISRPLVSKILNDAKELGFVTIQIKSPFEEEKLSYEKLKKIYDIEEIITVADMPTTVLIEQNIFKETIKLVKKFSKDIKVLGIGWGNVVGPLVDRIEKENKFLELRGKIIPLIGNTNIYTREYHPNDLVRIFGEKTGLIPAYLFAPAFLTSEQEKEIFMNIENYKEISRMWENMDTAIIGINSHPAVPDFATALRFGNALNKQKAVGNILSYYFDIDGKIIEGKNDFTIQVPLEKLKKSKRVIGIVSPKTNKNVVIGALKTGIFTHIIMRERLLEELL